MPTSYELISRETLAVSKGPVELVSVKANHADGREHITTEPVWTYGDSVAVLAYDPLAKTALMVRQMRPAVFLRGDGTILEACAGGIEESDNCIETACRREAAEELGVQLQDVEHLLTVYAHPARLSEKAHYFLGTYQSGSPCLEGRDQDDDEDIEVVELSLSELFSKYELNQLRCPALVTLTQALRMRLA